MTDQIITVIWIVFFGVCFASLYAYYQKNIVGDIVRALLKLDATGEDTAKTLDEIGYGDGIRNTFASYVLRHGAPLRKTVYAVFDDTPEKKKDADELFAKKKDLGFAQKYYIPEEKKYVADVRYDAEGSSAKTLLLSVAAFFAAALIIIALLPDIQSMINGFKDSFGKNDTPGYVPSDSTEEFDGNFEFQEN